jgi:putative aldouronate transport system permease protein
VKLLARMGRRVRRSADDVIFDSANYVLLFLVTVVMVIPFLHEISVSLSSVRAVNASKVLLTPVEPTLGAWKYIVTNRAMLNALKINVIITLTGVAMALFFSILFAYPLSKKRFRLAKPLMVVIVFTMIFRYPIIPYFLTVRSVGLYDNILVMVIPGILNAYHIVIMRSFFQRMPVDLEESAQIEGANTLQILWRIILPLSKPLLATMALFHAVIQWNMFFHALLFIRSADLVPLQIKLRELIAGAGAMEEMGFFSRKILEYSTETAKAAAVMFATIPILAVYPFLQRHFVKGAMLGSLKG